jgi:hypothetical protein
MNTKILYSIISLLLAIGLFVRCDKIENAYPNNNTDLDISLFPGNWDDYMENHYPSFNDNPAQVRNVLLEEYTGHQCNACPNAAILAKNIANNHPGRVHIAAVHAGPGGITGFQQFNPNSNQFFTNHTNPEGLEYGQRFQNGFNFFGNPQGNVSRRRFNGNMFLFTGTWATNVTNTLSENQLNVRLQSVFNYYESTGGGFLHVWAEKINNITAPINLVCYVIRDSIVDWQVMPDNSYNPDYVHTNTHMGSIDNRAWGAPLFEATASIGTVDIKDYSYKIPDNLDANNMHFLIYAYNRDTYEIYQVIRQNIQ